MHEAQSSTFALYSPRENLIFSLAGICRSPNRKLCRMPEWCEVVEMRNSADAVGYLCSRTASTQCSDCGSELCESHAETCGGCRSIFCPSCLSLHQSLHPKRASADYSKDQPRKSA